MWGREVHTLLVTTCIWWKQHNESLAASCYNIFFYFWNCKWTLFTKLFCRVDDPWKYFTQIQLFHTRIYTSTRWWKSAMLIFSQVSFRIRAQQNSISWRVSLPRSKTFFFLSILNMKRLAALPAPAFNFPTKLVVLLLFYFLPPKQHCYSPWVLISKATVCKVDWVLAICQRLISRDGHLNMGWLQKLIGCASNDYFLRVLLKSAQWLMTYVADKQGLLQQ